MVGRPAQEGFSRSAITKIPNEPGLAGCAGQWLSRLSIWKRLAVIVLVLAIPLNLIALASVWRLSEASADAQRNGLLYTARTVAAAVDAKVGQYAALGEVLSRFPSLLDDNLSVFEAEARRASASVRDATILVADINGQQLLNTASRRGQPLPVRSAAAFQAQKEALEKGAPVISGVRRGIVSDAWIISVEIPVFKDGLPFRSLAIVAKAEAFTQLLNQQNLPKNWLAGVIDAGGKYIARAVPGDSGQATGQYASDSWRRVQNEVGVREISTLEGVLALKANVLSRSAGWSIGVAVKSSTLQAAAWHTTRWALVVGGSLSILSLIFASLVARSIASPIGALRARAQAFFGGSASLPEPAGPPEVADLWRALKQAATDRDRSENALLKSEERLRLALDAGSMAAWDWHLPSGAITWNEEHYRILGYEPGMIVPCYEAWASRVLPEDLPHTEAVLMNCLAAAGEYQAEFRVLGSKDEIHWVEARGRFERDAAGRAVRCYGIMMDITGRKQAEAALRESEERLRHLGDSLPDSAIYRYCHDSDGKPRFLYISAGIERMNGVCVEEVLADAGVLHRQILPEYQLTLAEAEKRSRESLCDFKMEIPLRRPDGELRWMRLRSRPKLMPDGTVAWDGVQTDITDRKRTEEALRLLMEEMNHRCKNLLTVVQAIARQTVANRPQDFLERFAERIDALAQSHDLLVNSTWKGVDLASLIRSQLAHFKDLEGSRIELDGPAVRISASASQAIGMAVHELATNASKYGALSNENGHVRIDWHLSRDDSGGLFSIGWTENGGPPVTAPDLSGFGMVVVGTMAEMNLNAKVTLAFPVTGLQWRLQCPAHEVEEPEMAG